MAKVSVILPAAGAGRRFGGGKSKIFQPLLGKAVFLHALERLSGRSDVIQTLLVVSRRDIRELEEHYGRELRRLGAEIVEGGSDRTGSVRNALAKVSGDAELVCVHDAVRPCVRDEQIDAVFAAAETYGAAILAAPVHATLKQSADGARISRTVSREGLWQAQTPQVFRRELLLEAYSTGAAATDDAELVQRLGHEVRLVESDARNVKITKPADLALAERILRSQ
ncbi:MAG: 2-C-methyl-D-erythritol 4-phosphate cytidylyltransferase [Phycisphaerae bacterium]